MSFPLFRKDLSITGLLAIARQMFEQITDKSRCKIPLVDYLMSGLALFGLKFPSLLQFDLACRTNDPRAKNLRSLYGIMLAPSDTSFRERCDEISPQLVQPLYKELFVPLQRAKVLKEYTVMGGYHVVSIDGTEFFSSKKVHCDQCCKKQHRNGSVTYYHQALAAVLVNPFQKEVFPLGCEPISKQDGAKKNDCERNAAKRLLTTLRGDHPRLKMLVVEDGLASNAPHIQQLRELGFAFILGAKPGDHAFLFKQVETTEGTHETIITDERGYQHCFRYRNDVSLNETNTEIKVNFLEYWEVAPNGKKKRFSWVTDFHIHDGNLMELMRIARSRWKIENETFNTLKNQGYNFEHNFGHGHQNLSNVLMHLMMLAFLIDQIQQRCCRLFQAAQQASHSKSGLWRAIRSRFDLYYIPDWETLYRSIIQPSILELTYDTS